MMRETIVIEGEVEGMKFEKCLDVYVEDWEEVEKAILRFYGTEVESFVELTVEKGWTNCFWTYDMRNELSIV
ncbi:hypothetical protein [Salimicrobium flavidum]|uniref:Uncharacterized protein n=1 Tax=Salimicrobium flavidum TaxID=570947 RepID=A0A1N7JD79_9BACI|nr:hypothetical protein [Salimicrobium flavidum]SIS47226.1 hypothetical protein SAMN05421687_10560 [Salimicrobium flavidum]